ncbi:MAG TPA: hypothetical protein VK750_04535 [Cytophagaceae bacterium]|jgi:hypothetical protein|nr:hypothetical protein [Cytophagaceae bacterium]
MIFKKFYLLVLVSVAVYGQDFEPRTGSLQVLNQTFHEDYNRWVKDKIRQLGDSTRPVLVFTGDTLIFKYQYQRSSARIIPMQYHQLKAIDHLPLGIFALVSSWKEGLLREDQMQTLKRHDQLIDTVIATLDTYLFTLEIKKQQEQILRLSKQYLEELISTERYTEKGRTSFARGIAPLSLANADEAARLEVMALHAQVSSWLKPLDARTRKNLLVVVGSSHQARYRELSIQYFDRLLNEHSGATALTENKVVFAESVFTESGCLSMLARHLIDQEIGLAYFNDKYRMQRDLLSDATVKYLQMIFPDTSNKKKR